MRSQTKASLIVDVPFLLWDSWKITTFCINFSKNKKIIKSWASNFWWMDSDGFYAKMLHGRSPTFCQILFVFFIIPTCYFWNVLLVSYQVIIRPVIFFLPKNRWNQLFNTVVGINTKFFGHKIGFWLREMNKNPIFMRTKKW